MKSDQVLFHVIHIDKTVCTVHFHKSEHEAITLLLV
jgi:hypothetical protein